MGGVGLSAPEWYRMGTFDATSGIRMLRLDLLMQAPAGLFMSARLNFSTNNGVIVMNTYDIPPVAFNGYPDLQTSSVDWYYGTLGTDIVIAQNSNASYSLGCARMPCQVSTIC